jgi:3-dehydroquinate synthase
MRGIPFVQIPTTLLGMVDSSLGGKTGIDTKQGKNLIGAFYQPGKIFVDFDFIKNLPQRQVLNGYFEIVKMAITSNKQLFSFAEKNLESVKASNFSVLEHLVTEGIKIKAKIVEKDEKESDDRMILNFGHTIGHALEQLSGFRLLHGEAVALGVIAEAKISQLEGLLHKNDFDRIRSLMVKSGLDTAILKKWTPEQIIKAARKDKKTRGKKLRVVLIEGIGRLHRRDGLAASFISDRVIKKALTLAAKIP